MFNIIRTADLPIWVDVIKKTKQNAEEILSDLQLIDDLLILQESKNMLHGKVPQRTRLKTLIDKRIEKEIEK